MPATMRTAMKMTRAFSACIGQDPSIIVARLSGKRGSMAAGPGQGQEDDDAAEVAAEKAPDAAGHPPARAASARHEVTAGPDAAGGRLDRLLAEALPQLSRSRLKALIEEGRVSTGGQPLTSPAARVRAGQTFAIIVPEARPVALEGQAIPLEILYEDRDLI